MVKNYQDEPELRFPGFNDSWNVERIKDVANVVGGGTPKTDNEIFWDGDINWFTPTEIGKKYVYESKRKITEEGLKKSSAKLLPENTILLSTRATIGEVSISKNKTTTNQGFQSLVVKDNYDNEFIYYLIQLLKNDMIRLSSGSTFLEISKKEVENINIKIPCVEEQNKIASFFGAIDKKIELLEKKHKLYQDFKKYSLQQIFTFNLRFKDSDGKNYGEWKRILLKDADIIISDGNYGEAYPKEKDFKKEGIPFIRAVNIENSKLTFHDMKYISKSLHNNLLQGHLNENDILITTRGDIGLVAYVTKDFENSNINAQICLLRVYDNNINPKYLFYLLTTPYVQEQLLKFQTGSALKQLPKNNLKNLKLLFPCYEEQTKIADFLVEIDNSINLIQNTIIRMCDFKKSLLQKMFVK